MPSFAETIRLALALDESIYIAVQRWNGGIWLALAVVGLAGLSQSLGQSLVLFVNHVRPRRFVLAMLLSIFTYTVGYLLWSSSVWLVGSYAFGRNESWLVVAAVVGLAYAPQLLAFFELTPFFGNPFGLLLSLWSLVAIVIAVRVGLNLETWQAVVTSGLGWLLIQVWRRTLGRPIYLLGQWLERRAAGVPLHYTRRDVPKLRRRPRFVENWQNWTKRRPLPAVRRMPRGK